MHSSHRLIRMADRQVGFFGLQSRSIYGLLHVCGPLASVLCPQDHSSLSNPNLKHTSLDFIVFKCYFIDFSLIFLLLFYYCINFIHVQCPLDT